MSYEMSSKMGEKATAEVISVKSDDESTISTQTELPPYIDEGAVQSYEVKYKDWKCTRALVQDPQSKKLVYNCELPTLVRSHINLKSPTDDTQVATVNPFVLKKHITGSVRGRDLNLRYNKFLKCDYVYTSPAFGDATLNWKSYSGFSEMTYVLLDEQSLPIARWKISGPKVGPFKDLGKLEILEARVDSDKAREEILITGLTAVYLEIWARSNGTIGMSAIGTMVAVGASSSSG